MSARPGDVAHVMDAAGMRSGGPFGPVGPLGGPMVMTPAMWATMDRHAWKQWRREWRRQHRGPSGGRRFHVPLPLMLLLLFIAITKIGILAGLLAGLLTFVVVITAMGLATAALITRVAIPALRGVLFPAEVPAMPAPARATLPVPAGPHAYRQQLLDVLKDRYVRGEITLAEYEQRVGHVVRDPSVRHLG